MNFGCLFGHDWEFSVDPVHREMYDPNRPLCYKCGEYYGIIRKCKKCGVKKVKSHFTDPCRWVKKEK